jgi:class 3 adenylate cyclase
MPAHTPAVGMERKRAAILSADVAGYSRLMGEDEEATIQEEVAQRGESSYVQNTQRRLSP